MNSKARSIVGLPGSGLTTQCLQWLSDLLAEGVKPDRVLVLVRQIDKAREFERRFYQSHGNILGELQVKGYTSFVQSQLGLFWAEVCAKRPDLPATFQPLFLTKDLTQFLLSVAFDRCDDHFRQFRSCTLPDYKILDQLISDSYIAHNACLPVTEVGSRLANAWIDQDNDKQISMLKAIPCCLAHLRQTALEYQVIDFGLQFELFSQVLLKIDRFWQTWDYLIVDNAEESSEVFLHFYQTALSRGKHLFLSYRMGGACNYTNSWRRVAHFIYQHTDFTRTDRHPGMGELGMAITAQLEAKLKLPPQPQPRKDYTDRVKLLTESTYLKAIETTITTLENLLANHVPADRMALIMPRFDQVVMQVIQHSNISNYCSFVNPYVSFLRYPVIRAMLTTAQLTQLQMALPPTPGELAGMISLFVGTDRIRSMLLAETFDREQLQFKPLLSSRVDSDTVAKFNKFIDRLNFYQQQCLKLDLLWAHLIREFSPNFQLTATDREVLHSLMTTAKRFFQAFPQFDNLQFIQMLLSRGTPTILRQWNYEQKIIVATPLQFLKTDRLTDYQLWFNINAPEWRKPICKELLNHEVLNKSWQGGIYTAEMDQKLRTDELARILLNLCCRNQEAIYLIHSQTTVSGQINYADLSSKILQAASPT